MIWLKRILLGLVLFVAALLLTAWLAVSRLGSAMLLDYAIDYVDGLSVGAINGGLSSTIEFSDVVYVSDNLNLRADKVSVTLTWRCFLQFSVCAEQVSTSGVQLTLADSEEASEDQSTTDPSIIRLPFLVALDKLVAADTTINLADGTQISLSQLDTELRLYRRFRALSPVLAGLKIALPTNSAQAAPDESATLITLPDVWLPLDANIHQLKLTDAEIKQGEKLFSLEQLDLTTRLAGYDIDIQAMQLRSSLLNMSAKGKLQTRSDYPISLEINSNGKYQNLPFAGQLELANSLANLKLKLQTQKPLVSATQGTIQLLTESNAADISITWQPFTHKDLALANGFEVASGELSLQGDRTNYHLLAATAVSLAELPTPLHLNIDAGLNETRLQLNSVNAELLDGSIDLAGDIQLSEQLSWLLSADIQKLDLQHLNEDFPSEITGTVAGSGQFTDGLPNINVTQLDLTGTQLNYPLAVKASGAYAGNAGVAVSSFTLSHLDNHVQGFARLLLDRRIDADVIVSIPKLTDSVSSLSGDIRGNVMVAGEIMRPEVSANLVANNIATLTDGQWATLLQRIVLQVQGRSDAPTVALLAEHPEGSITSKIDLNVTDTAIKATPSELEIAFASSLFSLQQPADFTLDLTQQSVALSASMCLHSQQKAELCINEFGFTDEILKFSLGLDNLAAMEALTWSRTTVPIENPASIISAQINGGYSPENGLQATALAEVSAGQWTLGDSGNSITIAAETIPLSAKFAEQKLQLEASVVGPVIGKLALQSWLDVSAEQPQVDMNLVATRFDVSPFAFLSQEINELNGMFDADVSVTGEITQPSINGQLVLTDGLIDISKAPAILKAWEASIEFNGQSAAVDSTFILGNGNGALLGELNWQDGVALQATIQGNKLNFSHQDIALTLSPDLSVNYSPAGLRLVGELNIPKAKIKVDTLPQGTISESADVHLRGEPAPTSTVETAFVDLQINIDPDNNKQVELDAFGLEAFLTGDLRVTNQPSLSAFGDLQIVDGEYRAYGQELLIRTGDLQFNGAFSQPLLYIEAIRDPDLTEDGVIAGIRIDGLANQPNIQLFSEPTLDQSQTLAYLLSGRGNIGSGDSNNANYASLLFGLGVSNSESLTNRLGNALGIDDLRLQSKGSDKNTQFSVSGKLNEDLTVEYGVNLDSVSEVTLRYQLLPRLYLEAVSSLYESIFVYYRFSRGEVVRRTTKAAEEANSDPGS
ncbi:translocation/assembly module TamB domain-containing protein [Alteromonas flava]|uniref:translocation/assembly module TamB domain-containing protein n=1 Tax=Alteromonas flava TaxID=2048003 RepID=UPI000C28AD97|nr:translocation/assembly module TamB domain-containing protein [Alteromonas flava]